MGAHQGSALSVLEVHDPRTDAWTTETEMPSPRAGAASAVIDGRLYVVGGFTATEPIPAVSTLEIYDPVDPDLDGDGVLNDEDQCPDTAPGAVVHPNHGCSIEQLCPCEGPRDGSRSWSGV